MVDCASAICVYHAYVYAKEAPRSGCIAMGQMADGGPGLPWGSSAMFDV